MTVGTTAGPDTADVCIVGGGPAGLSTALALTGTGLKVVLLEAGPDRGVAPGGPVTAGLGNPYPQSDITGTRAASLGGTAGIWSYRMSNEPGDPGHDEQGCRYAPLDEIDLEARSDVPHSGWPLKRGDLDPWYEKAQPVCGLGAFAYDPESWTGPGRELLGLDPATVESQMFQFGPRSAFTEGVVGRLRQDGVRLVTGADVTDLEVAGDGVRAVRWRHADGTSGAVRARAVVLAAGGVENSRLLLRTAGTAGPGLGNRHDQVGRYWMEHPIVRGGLIVASESARLGSRLGLYDAHWQNGSKVMAKLSITPQTVRAEGLVSTALLLLPRADVMASPGFQAFTAMRSPSGRSASPLGKARIAAQLVTHAKDVLDARSAISGQPGSDDSGWAARAGAGRVRVFEMLHQTEQTPDPDNRIVLGVQRDTAGREIPELRWTWSADDRRRVTRARDLYARAFSAAGLGRLVQGDWDGGQPRMVGSTHHHMGGTRMSPDDRTGVVDDDGRVHGVRNLFVTGSSVFPTGGSVNPTLTIVALALKLGEHLTSVLPHLPS